MSDERKKGNNIEPFGKCGYYYLNGKGKITTLSYGNIFTSRSID